MLTFLSVLLFISTSSNAMLSWVVYEQQKKRPVEVDDQFDEDEMVMYGAVENSRVYG